MTDQPPTPPKSESVLGALPSSRPHRRSDKRRSAAPATENPTNGSTAAKTKAPAKKPTVTKRTSAAKKPVAAKKPAAAATAAAKAPATPRAKAPAGSRPSLRQPPQPRGLPPRGETRSRPKAEPAARQAPGRRDLLATAVQAAAELTEMGLSAGARALRDAVSRLPRR